MTYQPYFTRATKIESGCWMYRGYRISLRKNTGSVRFLFGQQYTYWKISEIDKKFQQLGDARRYIDRFMWAKKNRKPLIIKGL